MNARRDELATRLARLRSNVEAAAVAAGRADVPSVVVITKRFPASDVRLLHELGVRDVGENQDQEASAKHAECRDLDLRWHFVGRLQTNKASSVVRYADLVHSLDRPKLAGVLDRAAARAERVLPVLIQVSLDGDPARGGVPMDQLDALADRVAGLEHLELRGLMTVLPVGTDPQLGFARIHDLSESVRRGHPGADQLSAGMSGDYQHAVAHGATFVRVGAAVLGSRPTVG